jgi:hypothetical protein
MADLSKVESPFVSGARKHRFFRQPRDAALLDMCERTFDAIRRISGSMLDPDLAFGEIRDALVWSIWTASYFAATQKIFRSLRR